MCEIFSLEFCVCFSKSLNLDLKTPRFPIRVRVDNVFPIEKQIVSKSNQLKSTYCIWSKRSTFLPLFPLLKKVYLQRHLYYSNIDVVLSKQKLIGILWKVNDGNRMTISSHVLITSSHVLITSLHVLIKSLHVLITTSHIIITYTCS